MLTRLLKWSWDAPLAQRLPDWFVDRVWDPAERGLAWLRCRVHGHVDFEEMDGRSHVCVYCHKLLWVDR